VPGLFAALARKRLDRDKLLDKTRLVLAEKEIEATQAQLEVTKARADARVANAELETTKFRLQAKNMEALRVANSVHLRGAIGTFVEGIVRVTHVHVSIEQSLSPSPSAFTEAFQRDEVLPALNKKPNCPVTIAMWGRFLSIKADIRARVEKQTPWRNEKTAIEIGHVYSSLSGRIDTPQKSDAGVVISTDILTKEECLAVAALLFDYVPIEFDPPNLMEEYERNELRAA
jgi:multidrug efflux pump subunit AcrA (membrane-fusion protein)